MPKKLSNSFRVKRGNDYITVGPYTHPTTKKKGWRFGYQIEPGPKNPWKYITKATKEEAKEAAGRILEERAIGLVWSALSPARRRFLEAIERECPEADQSAVLSFIRSRRRSSEVVTAVAQFLAFKIHQAGEETPHLSRVRAVLEGMSAAFAGTTVADIHKPELEKWWTGRCADVGSKRKNDIRTDLVGFWNWAQTEGISPKEEFTPAERLPVAPLDDYVEPTIYTPEKFLELAAAVDFQDRAAIVLGGFCGLRPEECAPPQKGGSKKRRKRGLHREEIDWDFGVIRLPADVSKGGKRPRIIPLNDAAREWLEWAGVKKGERGAVCPRNLVEAGETERLGKLVFGEEGWPQDALRHSYGTYRNATLRNLAKVSEEMGSSEKMMHRHYHNPRAESEGTAWFATRPGDLIRSDKDAIRDSSAPMAKVTGL